MGHRQPQGPHRQPHPMSPLPSPRAEWLGTQEAESPAVESAVESACIRTWEEGGSCSGEEGRGQTCRTPLEETEAIREAGLQT